MFINKLKFPKHLAIPKRTTSDWIRANRFDYQLRYHTSFTPPTGYIAWWTFDNVDFSGGIVYDETNNYNGVITGTFTNENGYIGNSGNLVNAIYNTLTITILSGFPWDDFTISFWIKDGGVVSLGYGTAWGDTKRRMYCAYSSGTLTCRIGQCNGTIYSSEIVVSSLTDEWINVIMESSGVVSYYDLYINGLLQGTSSTYAFRTGSAPTHLGSLLYPDVTYSGLLAHCDELILYNKTLTTAEKKVLWDR